MISCLTKFFQIVSNPREKFAFKSAKTYISEWVIHLEGMQNYNFILVLYSFT